MIPRRKPPFGVWQIVKSLFADKVSVGDVEKAYSDEYGVPAVLLPSARAGISWAITAATESSCQIVCPAYTCDAVFEAVANTKGRLHLVDSKGKGFLLSKDTLRKVQKGYYAIILCEIYGHTYNLSDVAQLADDKPAIRIVDMAMTVTTQENIGRLIGNDFAVVSFGLGKSMYAGWGGVGFTRDSALADEIRKLRDKNLSIADSKLLAKRFLNLIVRSLAHKRLVYGFSRKIRDIMHPGKGGIYTPRQKNTADNNAPDELPAEWIVPSTRIDRAISLYNLSNAADNASRRLKLAKCYRENLEGVQAITLPDISTTPLSCYTIHVKPSVRPLLCKYLWKNGIDVGQLFSFHYSLDLHKFPDACNLSKEVLNLPIHEGIDTKTIDYICEKIKSGLDQIPQKGKNICK